MRKNKSKVLYRFIDYYYLEILRRSKFFKIKVVELYRYIDDETIELVNIRLAGYSKTIDDNPWKVLTNKEMRELNLFSILK